MTGIIKDGAGKGYSAEVDSKNRLHVDAVTLVRSANAVFDGDAYNINTGTINMTGTSRSGLLYVKNTGTNPIIIDTFIYLLGNSDAATGDTKIEIIRNPTTGTLIDSGTAFTPVNRNFASAKTLSATVLKGAQGNTVTNGDVVIESIISGDGRQVVTVGAIIVAKNNSIAVVMTPKAGNSDQDVQMAISCYEERELEV
jgi:hypothetical protein